MGASQLSAKHFIEVKFPKCFSSSPLLLLLFCLGPALILLKITEILSTEYNHTLFWFYVHVLPRAVTNLFSSC